MDLANFQLIRKPRASSQKPGVVAKLDGELTKRVIKLIRDGHEEQVPDVARE